MTGKGDIPLKRRVIKLGGSLLDWPEVVPRFRAWLAGQSPAENVLVVGGGKLADCIRDADRVHHLDETVAHWLCVRAMAMQTEMIHSLLADALWLSSVKAWQGAAPTERLLVLDPWHFLTIDEPRLSRSPLPMSWNVTSDSIAARLAEIALATELVLLKSALPADNARDANSLMATGYVDRYFQQATTQITAVRCVNLRSEGFTETILGG